MVNLRRRRGLIAAALGGMLARPPALASPAQSPPTMKTLAYGTHPDQRGDLRLPAGHPESMVCLLHGGFWKMPYGRDQMDAIADDLCRRGHAVWNIGYRRVGQPGVGWPQIRDDVVAAIDYVAEIEKAEGLVLPSLSLVGHSAGGQLAVACTAPRNGGRRRPRRIVSLAGLLDLEAASVRRVGGDAVERLLGGSIRDVPEAYADASPVRLLPHGCELFVIHGLDDDAVPIGQARSFVSRAKLSRDRAELIELEGCGHMDFLDPATKAHEALCGVLSRTGEPAMEKRC